MNDQFILLFALGARNMTRAEIAGFLEITDASACKRLARLRANKLVRVVDHRRQPDGMRGKPSPVYGLGDPALDVPAPPRVPLEVRRAKHLARQEPGYENQVRRRYLARKGPEYQRDIRRRFLARKGPNYEREARRRSAARKAAAAQQLAEALWGQLGRRKPRR